jgi:hypothetical protein
MPTAPDKAQALWEVINNTVQTGVFEPSSAYHEQSAGKGEEENAALQVKNAGRNATGHGVLTSPITKSPHRPTSRNGRTLYLLRTLSCPA